MEMGNRIKTLRLAKSMTQEQLARALHVSAQAVSKWELGGSLPDIQLLLALSVVLGTSIDALFSLTDETYSLFFVTKVPKDVKEEQFLFAIAVLDQSYWIIGSGIGALLGNVLPFSAEGIDFAMTALFVVIMVEQWMEKQNRPSVVIGLVCGLVCRLVFGADNFILPTMICVMVILLSCKKIFDKMIPEDGKEGGEPECQ